jgi:multicomponent Na+:H+ antiporter subunit G
VSALVGACLAAGLFFHGVAALGVLRMPDFYTRLHAVSKAETLGVVLTLAGVAAASDSVLTAVKIAFVAMFLFLANPTATHALGRAAFRLGVPPWTGEPEPDR